MLCPFKRTTRRFPSELACRRSFGNCDGDNCMAYYEKEEYATKPPFSMIGKRPACRLIEIPYAAPIAYCPTFGSADVGTNPEALDDE